MAEDLPNPAVTDLIPAPDSDRLPDAVLAAVPGCEQGRPPLAIRALAGGGWRNDVRRVDTAAGQFVVRRRLPPLSRAASDPCFELECQRLAARHGLAPRVVAAANDASWLVMEFVEGAVWGERDLHSAAGVRRLGARLEQVHALTVPAGGRPMDAGEIVRQQLRVITSSANNQHLEAADLAHRATQLAQIVRSCGAPTCINHGDLQASNLLGPLPMFIDWEYAQIAVPTYDIACLLTYYPRLQASQSELMSAAGLRGAEHLELLDLQKQLFACLNRLWGIANDMEAG